MAAPFTPQVSTLSCPLSPPYNLEENILGMPIRIARAASCTENPQNFVSFIQDLSARKAPFSHQC